MALVRGEWHLQIFGEAHTILLFSQTSSSVQQRRDKIGFLLARFKVVWRQFSGEVENTATVWLQIS